MMLYLEEEKSLKKIVYLFNNLIYFLLIKNK